jgi:hypothetical protein
LRLPRRKAGGPRITLVAPAGADRGLEFASGHRFDEESADQIPANMIGRLLDDSDLRKLHGMLVKKRPPAR